MTRRIINVWGCVGLAVGIDLYIQLFDMSTLSYFTVALATLFSLAWHVKTALPAAHHAPDVPFEKKLFLYGFRLVALLALFQVLRPEFLSWALLPEDTPLLTRAGAGLWLSSISALGSAIVVWLFKSIDAVFASQPRLLNLDVSAASGGVGAVFIAMTLSQFNAPMPLIGYGAACAWLATCLLVGSAAEKRQFKQLVGIKGALGATGVLLLLSTPLVALLSNNGSHLTSMDFGEALDHFVIMLFWGVAAATGAGVSLAHSLYETKTA